MRLLCLFAAILLLPPAEEHLQRDDHGDDPDDDLHREPAVREEPFEDRWPTLAFDEVPADWAIVRRGQHSAALAKERRGVEFAQAPAWYGIDEFDLHKKGRFAVRVKPPATAGGTDICRLQKMGGYSFTARGIGEVLVFPSRQKTCQRCDPKNGRRSFAILGDGFPSTTALRSLSGVTVPKRHRPKPDVNCSA